MRNHSDRDHFVTQLKGTLTVMGELGLATGHRYAPNVAVELCATIDRVIEMVDDHERTTELWTEVSERQCRPPPQRHLDRATNRPDDR